ncbi:MAG TPA: DNA mismatch repair endonuclease MutL [Chthoniobacteraceae bacterium]|nr:DNA mismatch repair endonuclease MutL [Chthoniobacteraceae bacterium]
MPLAPFCGYWFGSMPRIHLLSETVASQVAAGEVVERPASVVKELVENSIDSGATRVELLIRRGGISYIRVADNGCGMDRDDALMCLERHATSKIRTGEDLSAIRTLGFRGEALPSIASVSRFRLATREREALAGTEIILSGGKIETVRDGGDAPGTQIEVRSLFYNLPARRKFLRTENTEAHHVEHQMLLQALGHPQVGFTFLHDERVIYQLPPAAQLIDRIRDLCGVNLAAELLPVVETEEDGISIRGWIGKAGLSRSTRQQQLVFLNGRAVENTTLNYALREGYHTALMKGQHPVTFLFIDMDPAAVDVNVHPSKREVRFRDAAFVRDRVCQAIRRTLESGRSEWSQTFRPTAPEPVVDTEPPLIPVVEQIALRRDWASLPLQAAPVAGQTGLTGLTGLTSPAPASVPLAPAERAPSPPAAPEPPAARPPVPPSLDFKILGVLGKLYILMENSSGLVLVDQHAAHERILFEEMRRRMETHGVPTQRLLLPLTLQVTPKDADWLLHHLELLERAGISMEPFGASTFKIDALPTFVRSTDPSQLLHDVIDELRETTAQTSKLRLGEDMIAKTVCRHAVKANDYLREPELVRLIQDLLACELPYCCPHGRPTMIQMSYLELEKKFGRKA